MNNSPRISIVTPSFNQGRFIEKTILSVIEQGYPNLEYIIIDGGSTDESVEIIKKYEKHLAYWVSEPDRGQSHAINKGFEHATGEIFGWLNSDDWYHPGALKAVAEAFAANPEAGAVVGAGDYVDHKGDVIGTIAQEKVDLDTLYAWFDYNFWQPSCFYSSTVWQQAGPLDESLQLCMDYDLWIKIAKKFNFVTIPKNLSATLLHSNSKTFQSSHEADLLTLKLVMLHGGPAAFEKIMESYRKRLASFDQAAQQRENRLQKELYFAKREIELLHRNSAQLNEANKQLKESLSWRVTAPLRRTLDIIKGVKPEQLPLKNVMRLDLCDSVADKKRKLIFPEHKQPLVSIVIPVHNQFALTWTCLTSILKHTSSIPFEIIIADDASSDKTCSLAVAAANITIARNEIALGFLKNCNNAAASAKGEFILFLNNDVVVQSRWLDPLIDVVQKDSSVGIVGSKLLFPDGTLQAAGGIIWRDGTAANFGREDEPFRPEYNYIKEVDYIPGASLLIRKKLWDEIGGFDNRYAPAYYEDTDLCFEVRERGYRVVYQPLSVVVHFEGKSHGTDPEKGIKQYQVINHQKFADKWQKQLLEQFVKGDYFNARDRSQGKKKIFVSDIWVPEHDKNAGARCTRIYLELFKSIGLHVSFHSRSQERTEPYATQLEQLGIEVLVGIDVNDWLYNNLINYDYIYLHRPDSWIMLNVIKTAKNPKAKLLYFAHDLHHVRLRRQYEVSGDEKFLHESIEVEQTERLMFETADVIHVVGEYEASLLSREYPDKPVRNIPLYVFDDRSLTQSVTADTDPDNFEHRCGILFVGSFTHTPNVDAVHWIMKDVWPKVSAALPELVFYIAGSNPPSEIRSYANNNVIITGYISDPELEKLYISCRMLVIPLRFGAGVKGKVLEGMKLGIPIITTPVGSEGIPLADEALIVRDWDQDWAEEIISWYQRIDDLQAKSIYAISVVKNNFSSSVAKKILYKDIYQ